MPGCTEAVVQVWESYQLLIVQFQREYEEPSLYFIQSAGLWRYQMTDSWAHRSGRRELGEPRWQHHSTWSVLGEDLALKVNNTLKDSIEATVRASSTKSCCPMKATSPRRHLLPPRAETAVGRYTAINMPVDGGSRAGPPSVTSSTHQPLKPMTRESTVQKCHP